jgi:hypothetical protein
MAVCATWLYVLFVCLPTAYLRLLLCLCIHLIHSLYSSGTTVELTRGHTTDANDSRGEFSIPPGSSEWMIGIYAFFFFFKTRSDYVVLAWNSLCGAGWPWALRSTCSASQMLGLKECPIMPWQMWIFTKHFVTQTMNSINSAALLMLFFSCQVHGFNTEKVLLTLESRSLCVCVCVCVCVCNI